MVRAAMRKKIHRRKDSSNQQFEESYEREKEDNNLAVGSGGRYKTRNGVPGCLVKRG